MRIYITGANGYLGGWLVKLLEEKEHHVIGTDSHGGIVHVHHDIPMKEVSIDKCDCVVLLAWYTSVGNRHEKLQDESVKRTIALVEYLAEKERTKKLNIIFASSAAVYGNYDDDIVNEKSPLLGTCAYSHAKVKAEKCIIKKLGKHNSTIFRFGSLMGLGLPGTRTKKELVVNAFAIDGYAGKKIRVWNHNDFKPVLHVRDAVELIISAVEAPPLYRGIYNASMCSMRAIDIAHIASRITGANLDIVHQAGSIARSCNLDSSALSHLNPFCHKGNHLRTVEQTIREFRDYVETPNDTNTPWEDRIAHGLLGGEQM